MILGIDEAGRGPVIGPMVLAGVLVNEKDVTKLEAAGVKDSKLLSPKQRSMLFTKIKRIAKDFRIIIVSPQEIDEAVRGNNLNFLEADKTGIIANELPSSKLIVDCPSPNCHAYREHLRSKLNEDCEIVAEHKADVKYAVVSAASVLAKVTRDAEVKKIQKEIGIDFGSGYPSDPRTIKFLDEYYKEFPDIFRKTWEPYKQVLRKREQRGLVDFLK